MMNRKLTIAAALILLSGSAAMAQKSSLATDTQHGKVGTTPCGSCHAAHGGTNGNTLLWMISVGTSTYTVYTSASLKNTPTNIVSPGNKLLVAGTPSNNTLLCMSCHDGALAVTNGIKLVTANYGLVGGAISGTAMDIGGTGSNTLTDDHPVNLAYDPTKNTTLASVASVTAAGVALYTGGAQTNFLECGSCHNPHQGPIGTNVPKSLTTGYYLRKANDQSQLCLACHL